jgi:Hemerythrin HHE cation binding domain
LATPQHYSGPSTQARDIPSPTDQPGDVIELIMADHRRIRRLCQALDDTARWSGGSDPDWIPAHVWQRLASLLEAHVRAEEEICHLPMYGCDPHAAERRREAVADHDDIREAITEAHLRHPGSRLWWMAVSTVLVTTVEHLDREERGPLAASRPRLTMQQRRELGCQYSAFITAWTLDAAAGEASPKIIVALRHKFGPTG